MTSKKILKSKTGPGAQDHGLVNDFASWVIVGPDDLEELIHWSE